MNLIVLNPHAGGGKTLRLWPKLEPVLLDRFGGELIIAITKHVHEVAAHIDKARAIGVERIIVVGGDGTNHAIVNALVDEPAPEGAPPIAVGQVPVGTGMDWSRTLGIPTDPVAAIGWLAEARPCPCDVGRITTGDQRYVFLNIASAGVGADVSHRVNAVRRRRPWTFIRAILTTLLRYRPQPVRIVLDGAPFFEGPVYIAAVANGQWFGHGIQAAPGAAFDDGLFDVVVAEGMSHLSVLQVLMKAYKGEHIGHPRVHTGRAACVEVTPLDGRWLGMELDGEPRAGDQIRFEVLPSAIQMLSRPKSG
ncbi:MAG: diacylglycerol kinase family lipid kinase [Anaerolineae bacterium]|nr:diacylglycerol kinase family lipid kinase [Anaerolineae bacterium]